MNKRPLIKWIDEQIRYKKEALVILQNNKDIIRKIKKGSILESDSLLYKVELLMENGVSLRYDEGSIYVPWKEFLYGTFKMV